MVHSETGRKHRQTHSAVLPANRVALGTWAIGGPWSRNGRPCGLGNVEDKTAIAALRHGIDLGVTVIDTADVYGCGHAERLVARAIEGRREQVLLATKFGTRFDEDTRASTERCIDPEFIRESCHASLRRLKTEVIDLYQLHWAACPSDRLEDVVEVLESLMSAGLIRSYGWSTDDSTGARHWLGLTNGAIQHTSNLTAPNQHIHAATLDMGSWSLARSPFATGSLLSHSEYSSQNDIRSSWSQEWNKRHQKMRSDLFDLAHETGVTPAHLILRWGMWRMSNVTTIVGVRNKEHVAGCVDAESGGPLPEQVSHRMSQIADFGRASE